MSEEETSLPVVLSCDRNMLAGLHVTAMTMLESYQGAQPLDFHLFHPGLKERDFLLLRETLSRTGKPFRVIPQEVDPAELSQFPTLMGSVAQYLRLFAPARIDRERILYCDIDTLCRMDVSNLFTYPMNGSAAAMVPEAPIDACIDSGVVSILGDRASGSYYNSGILLIDRNNWLEQDVTGQCLEFLSTHPARFWDQTALNYVLHGKITDLPADYNCRTNARENWTSLMHPNRGKGRFLHFIDFPKPWSPFARWCHAMGPLWWREYRKTAHSSHRQPVHNRGRCSTLCSNWGGYYKASKDRCLFKLLDWGLVSRVKGM